MKHAKILSKSPSLIICDISLSVSVSQTESKKREKRFVSRLSIASRDVSDGGP